MLKFQRPGTSPSTSFLRIASTKRALPCLESLASSRSLLLAPHLAKFCVTASWRQAAPVRRPSTAGPPSLRHHPVAHDHPAAYHQEPATQRHANLRNSQQSAQTRSALLNGRSSLAESSRRRAIHARYCQQFLAVATHLGEASVAHSQVQSAPAMTVASNGILASGKTTDESDTKENSRDQRFSRTLLFPPSKKPHV
jgi:hypothetical protein